MQESGCKFISIPPDLLIDQCNSTVPHPSSPLCLAGHCFCYGLVLGSYAALSHGIPWNIPRVTYFLGIRTQLKARVYTEKIQVTPGIFHSLLLENINIHHSFNKYLLNALHQAGINNRVSTVNEPR